MLLKSLKMGLVAKIFAAAALAAPVLAGTNAKGKEYLEKKGKEEGVITLPSGLMYKVLNKGDGKHHPTGRQQVGHTEHGKGCVKFFPF